MKALVVDCGSSKVPLIVDCATRSGFECTVEPLSHLTCNTHHAVIVSGAPILLTQQSHVSYLRLFEPLLHPHIPLLGICFGHQLLGLSHGASVSLCNEDRDWQHIHFRKDDLFESLHPSCQMMEDHTEHISLPMGWHLLGSSAHTPNEAMKHPDFMWYGVQFHPEASTNNGQLLFNNFFRLALTRTAE